MDPCRCTCVARENFFSGNEYKSLLWRKLSWLPKIVCVSNTFHKLSSSMLITTMQFPYLTCRILQCLNVTRKLAYNHRNAFLKNPQVGNSAPEIWKVLLISCAGRYHLVVAHRVYTFNISDYLLWVRLAFLGCNKFPVRDNFVLLH